MVGSDQHTWAHDYDANDLLYIVHIEQKEEKLLTVHIVRHTMTTSGDRDQSTGCICSFGGRQERYDFRHFLHLSGTSNSMHYLETVAILKKTICYFEAIHVWVGTMAGSNENR